jgi:hypothetical protein
LLASAGIAKLPRMKRSLFGVVVAAAIGCGKPGVATVRLKLQPPGGAAMTLVELAGAELRVLPGSGLQEGTIGGLSVERQGATARIVTTSGVEVLACKGGALVEGGKPIATIDADGFHDEVRKVTVDGEGRLTFVPDDPGRGPVWFEGLDGGDVRPCVAALLFHSVPAPHD